MSTTKHTYSVSKTGGAKFCKICKDLGKTRDEYTSHFVRETPNLNSKVVCPVLISSVCRYCKEGGHTVKHCPKIETKKQPEGGVKIYTTNHQKEIKQTINININNFSTLSAFSDDEEDEKEDEEYEEDIIVTPPTKSVVSYSSILQKAQPIKPVAHSQAESLIPIKLNFDGYVVTLEKITKRWADEEEPDECVILYTKVSPLIPFNVNHPLSRFVDFVDALASDYTNKFSKSIAITVDAFTQLSKNWETEFFVINGGRDAFDESPATNASMRSKIMTERYIQ